MTRRRADLLDEKLLWAWIKETSPEPYDSHEHLNQLLDLLIEKTVDEILGFDDWLHVMFLHGHQDELWCAAYQVIGSGSQSSFEYFRQGLLLLGEEIYKNALIDPDSLSDHWDRIQDLWVEMCPALGPVALKAKTGLGLDQWVMLRDAFTDPPSQEIPLNSRWTMEDEETQRKIVPRLYFKRLLHDVAERQT